jgi:hypothetical protein
MGGNRLSFWFDQLFFIGLMGNRLFFRSDGLRSESDGLVVASTPCLSSGELPGIVTRPCPDSTEL